ncbi:hypothetical protein LXL04_016328 [Taraxacum kok-saghyz]
MMFTQAMMCQMVRSRIHGAPQPEFKCFHFIPMKTRHTHIMIAITFEKKNTRSSPHSHTNKLTFQIPQIEKKMTMKPNTTTGSLTPAEIKIGTKGTIGSLMMKEIEYFNMLEVKVHSRRHILQVPEAATTSSELDSVNKTPKSKKRGNKFVPRFCSVIDVADINGPRMISGFNYKTLKADVRKLQMPHRKMNSVGWRKMNSDGGRGSK